MSGLLLLLLILIFYGLYGELIRFCLVDAPKRYLWQKIPTTIAATHIRPDQKFVVEVFNRILVKKMKYDIEFKPRALKDCRKIPKSQLTHIFEQIETMSGSLKGDVKRLANFTPEYRLRVGDYRILFEIEGERLIIYRVRHRKEAYK